MELFVSENQDKDGFNRGLFLYKNGFQLIVFGRMLTIAVNRRHIIRGSLVMATDEDDNSAVGHEFHMRPLSVHRVIIRENGDITQW